jgi:glycosyltransferase involved in cell wall biosynthesis
VNAGHVPTVLAIVDRPGWATDIKAQNLRRALRGRFDVLVRSQTDTSEEEIDAADIVLIFYWLQVLNMSVPESVLARRRDRLLMGICSHVELEGERRERGLAALRRLPRAVFVNSRALEREYAPLLNVPVHYTPNGVDTTFFRPASAQQRRRRDELRIGWAGSLGNHGAAHRRFHDVIQPAVAAVPGVRLFTAIREERWRNHDEMLEFYRNLDLYVCASRSEGTPNPCLEAAACGVPVVTTRVGNMPELIEDGVNGLFFDGTLAQLVDRLKLLRDEPSVLGAMSSRIRESIAAWDWSVQAANYAHLFESVLEPAIS